MLNLANLRTPGVYIDEERRFPPSIAQVETAIPVFIGYTQRARFEGRDVFNEGIRISSLLEYVEIFGEAQPEQNIVVTIDQDVRNGNIIREFVHADIDFVAGGASRHNMFYALQIYFANGGGPCWIVSVGAYLAFGTEIPSAALENGLREVASRLDEPTLIVFPEGQGMQEAGYYTLIQLALQQCDELKDRFVVFDIHNTGRGFTNSTQINNAALGFRAIPQIGGLIVDLAKYGAAYFPNIRSTFDYQFNDGNVRVVHNVNGQPGGEFDGQILNAIANGAMRSKVRQAVLNLSLYLPPSPAIVGVYARVDNKRGVWKAPANEGLTSVDDLTVRLDDQQQRNFNVDTGNGLSINVIRKFVDRGIRIWGARTLAGNDNEWRYISVRRFFTVVEESVQKATYQFVFEPNDMNTWIKVKGMIENFLILQWRAGALQGATPEKAFFVKVGLGETMTALDILEGRMIVEIGMAVVRPAEFIILRFSHKMVEA
jgi:uncharacterized protein